MLRTLTRTLLTSRSVVNKRTTVRLFSSTKQQMAATDGIKLRDVVKKLDTFAPLGTYLNITRLYLNHLIKAN
jgi:hypothetical protein